MYGNRRITKRGYKKKRNPYGGFKATNVRPDYNSNWTRRQLNVFLHPFSVSTVAAKIPDGKVTLSCAQRRQQLTNIEINQEKGILYVLVHPGINSTIAYAVEEGTVAAGTAIPVLNKWKTQNFEALDEDETKWKDQQKIKEFRIVSAGLKATLHNQTDQNMGYFEAIRIPTSSTDRDELINQAIEYLTTVSTSFIDQPSYSTGKLKDIHKYVFQCKPDGNSHNLVNVGVYDDTELDQRFKIIDPNMDAVLIKIQGRANGVDGTFTKLILHGISNQEVVFEPTSGYHRFMSESTYDSRFDVAVHAAAVNIKAATKNYYNT